MRTDIPSALLEHFQRDSSTLALLWAIERRDGLMIRGTEHDDDIQLETAGSPSDELAGFYASNQSITLSDITSPTDMSVPNTEAEGTLQQQPYTVISDLTVRDIEGGLLDMAPVWVMVCNWRDPGAGYAILRRGFLGEISRDSDQHYKTEVRGLAQLLSQTLLDTYSERCNVKRLGDERCKLDISALTTDVTVSSVETRARFHVTGLGSHPEQYYGGGIIRGLTGANQDIEREIKRDNTGGSLGFISLWDEFPLDITAGDTFVVEPGCARDIGTCRDKFDNVVNFRGWGALIPGVLELLKGPT